MTRNRFIRRPNTGRINSVKSAVMNRARWSSDRARRDAEAPAIAREIAEIDAQNLPRKQGDALGVLQWSDFATGQTRRWIVRIGDRADRITLESPQGKRTGSHGWTWALSQLRKHLTK